MDISRRTALGAFAAAPLVPPMQLSQPKTILVADQEERVADIICRVTRSVMHADIIKVTDIHAARHVMSTLRHDLAIIFWGLYQSPPPRQHEVGSAYLITSYFDDKASLGRPFRITDYYAQLKQAPAFSRLDGKSFHPSPRHFGVSSRG